MRDFLQAASNTAADTVAAPVDLIAFLLRKAGVPVPQNAVGGTQWMTERGLRRDVQQSPASLAGETVGLLSPVVAAAKAPQIAKGLLQVKANAAAPKTLRPEAGAIVWHGSPYKFDRFDASKIGTGEGAQAYGHGLYMAEAQNTGKTYADTLGEQVLIKGKPVYRAIDNTIAADAPIGNGARTALQGADWNIDKARTAMADAFRTSKDQFYKRALDELSALTPADIERKGGYLYKVDLPEEKIARMLDWDKPLSQQPEAVRQKVFGDIGEAISMTQDALSKASGRRAPTTSQELEKLLREQNRLRNLSGQAFYQQLSRGDASGAADAATQLRALGIPGIRYLDGGSRGAGKGTSNFVVFPGEEQFLRILERNGGLLGP